MNKEQYIPNSGKSLFFFYMEKFCLCLGCVILGGISYLDGQQGGNLWHWFVPAGIILFLVADSVGLPIGKTEDQISFHRLWRISHLQINAIRFLWISDGIYSSFPPVQGPRQLICVTARPWGLFLSSCDDINGVAEQLEKHSPGYTSSSKLHK
ncbi:hypothetical protein [Pseudodesulfovibrio sp.]|uniref:hypothetical protein n=1 Tax=unclassified Pseudodesulfovibrio TaxID=2661612 RepID=UPI003AFFFCF4